MLCPFCLRDAPKFSPTDATLASGKSIKSFVCPDAECGEIIPPLYNREYSAYPPLPLLVVGTRGHGKTLYFSALLHALRNADLGRYWPKFSVSPINTEAFTTVFETLERLEDMDLPRATPSSTFPRPGLLQLGPPPFHDGSTVLLYDIGGEVFESPDKILDYASFVRAAPFVLFVVSISDLPSSPTGRAAALDKLLAIYINGVSTLGGERKRQDLVVLYTKAEAVDQLAQPPWNDIGDYADMDFAEDPPSSGAYGYNMLQISKRLREFTREVLGAANFVSAAEGWFRSVEFCAVSALGARPTADNRLSQPLAPRRVIDPLLFLMQKDRQNRAKDADRSRPSAQPAKDASKAGSSRSRRRFPWT